MTKATETGYAEVNGIRLYWESRGSGGTPLVLLHGGYGSTSSVADVAAALATDRQVISVDLQGHGRTADIDRPITCEAMGDDISALIDHLALGETDLMGYSFGGGAALRCAIQHPDRVRRLVVISTPFSNTAWYPAVWPQMQQMGSGLFEMFKHTPQYAEYAAVAPDVDHFPELMDKMGALLRSSYDWSDDVRGMDLPVLLVFGDADSMPISYVGRFFELLGGNQADGSWDRSGVPASKVAILPDTTHYDIFASPLLPGIARTFLA